MARSGHDKKDEECEDPELLEWKLRDAMKALIRYENTKERCRVALGVELDGSDRGVEQTQKKRGNTQMTAVIQQRQETRIEPAKRPNTENDGQQEECRGGEA